MSNDDEVTVVTEYLEKLATEGDPDRIAALLARQGVRGDRNPFHCPVAVAVQQATGRRVGVGHKTWTVPGHVCGRLPEPVSRFVVRHDAGRYPALMTEP